MKEYQQLYYSLFNSISDLINTFQQKDFSREDIILSLQKLQSDAEEKFIRIPEINSMKRKEKTSRAS